jgi:hypothetical protein
MICLLEFSSVAWIVNRKLSSLSHSSLHNGPKQIPAWWKMSINQKDNFIHETDELGWPPRTLSNAFLSSHYNNLDAS